MENGTLPALVNELLSRIRTFFRPRAADREFGEELESHLAMAEAEHRRRGLSREESRRRARVELGGIAQLNESQRETRGIPFVDGLGLDLKLAVRMLVRSWGLTVIGGLSMAVVMGFGAAIFAVLQTVEGSALPVPDGDRVVAIQPYDSVRRDDFSTPFDVYRFWRDNLGSFREVGAVRTIVLEFVPEAFSRAARVAEMTPSVFRALGVGPHLGRFLAPDDNDVSEPVVVMGYDPWQEWFGGDPGVIGRRVDFMGTQRTVVGVMPEGFAFPVNEEFWIPFPEDFDRLRGGDVTVIARLADGVSLEAADAEVAVLGLGDIANTSPIGTGASGTDDDAILGTRVVPYASTFNDDFRDNPWLEGIALTLAFLLLVPPAANIGVLLYARNVSRREEFAARYALGAGRRRIVGQLFVEALVLSAFAGVGALFVAGALLDQFQGVIDRFGAQIPFWMVFEVSVNAVFFVLAVVVFAAALTSVLPALRATGALAASALQGLGARTGPRLGRTWTVMVAAQAALAMAAVPSAGPVVWELMRPVVVGPGFPVDEFLVGAPTRQDPDSELYSTPSPDEPVFVELARRVAEMPGVRGIAFSAGLLPGFGFDRPIEVEGADRLFRAIEMEVDNGYFELFNAEISIGRDFGPGDRPTAPVIVNRTFAEQAFGSRNPVGARIREVFQADQPGVWQEIVGVVEDIDGSRPAPHVFHPIARNDGLLMIVRGRPDSLSRIAVGTREIAATLDPDLDVFSLAPFAESYRSRLINEGLVGLSLAVALAVTALFSLAGMHTLVAFSVARGRREIGIRAALGARPGRLVVDLLVRVLRPIAVGAVAGAIAAVFLNAWLLESTTSPGTFLLSMIAMIAVSALALSGPARRVASVDPADELRAG